MGVYIAALRNALRRFDEENGWQRSSHIALSMMFALFPFCIFCLSLAGFVSVHLKTDELIEFVFGTWPDVVAQPIISELEAVLAQSSGTTLTFSALLAVFFASNGVDAIRISITEAYREKDIRPMWKTRLLCIAFVIFGGALLVTSAALLVALPLYFKLFEIAPPDLYLRLVAGKTSLLVAVAALVFAVIACHKWLPGIHRPLRDVMPGVILTLVLWGTVARLFEFYLVNYATYSVTYAGLAGVLAAQLFMYLMAVIFVFGAEFNGRLASLRRATA
ncbi:MAG: YihY/virulence factor BrkB family protein [Paracoccaceae bacterium]